MDVTSYRDVDNLRIDFDGVNITDNVASRSMGGGGIVQVMGSRNSSGCAVDVRNSRVTGNTACAWGLLALFCNGSRRSIVLFGRLGGPRALQPIPL